MAKTFYNNHGVTGTIEWSPEFAKRMNGIVGQMGTLQKFTDEMIMSDMEPYMPLLTGVMIASMFTHTVIGSGEIVVDTPYARRQYWEGRLPGQSQTGALRGRLYFERAKNDNLRSWERQIQDKLDSGG